MPRIPKLMAPIMAHVSDKRSPRKTPMQTPKKPPIMGRKGFRFISDLIVKMEWRKENSNNKPIAKHRTSPISLKISIIPGIYAFPSPKPMNLL
jgi:hypothetical protein